MPFLKSSNGHEPCDARIQKYLEKDERAIARDFVNLNTPDEQKAWGYHMDNTRSIAGNDTDWCGKKAIMYKHFMISPDPRDQISLEKLRELTMRWVHEFFGDDVDSGKLGSYQVAVIYHDDNTRHIPHAHVIVNNTNLDTGYRLQIDNKTNEHTLPDRLQEIAASEEFNLSYFTNDNSQKKFTTKDKRFYTRVERSMIRQGRFVWKSDLADRIDIARRTNTTTEGFISTLGSLGVDVEDRDDDYLYVHQSNPEQWKSYGYRIGADYSKNAIASSLEKSREDNLLKPESSASSLGER